MSDEKLDLNDFPSTEWIRALRRFDDGDSSIVAKLLLDGAPMSLHVREFLADVVTGKRKVSIVGKARKVLNADHKELLRQSAMSIQALGHDPATRILRQLIKVDAIARTVALSGVSNGTANQAWKVANSKWAKLAAANKSFQVGREAQKKAACLRELGKLNDPFKRDR